MAKLACGRVGDNIDGMAVQPGRPALRILSGSAACMTASWCICMVGGIVPPRVTVEALMPQAHAACHGSCTSQSRHSSREEETCHARRRLIVQGEDSSCKAETCRVRRRLVVRGGDLSHEVETRRATRRLVMQGRDLSCRAETCRVRWRLVRGGPSCGELVRDAANWSEA
jgi:hypothetical protein